jgi:hypothetical protein
MQRLWGSDPQAADDDCSNARSNGRANQQPACDRVSRTEHDDRQKQHALYGFEPSESMALALVLNLQRMKALLERLEFSGLGTDRQ